MKPVKETEKHIMFITKIAILGFNFKIYQIYTTKYQ